MSRSCPVKAYDNATALPMLAPLMGPDTVVLTLQNGVDSVDEVAAVVGQPRVLGGTTYVATALEGPGLIVQTGVHRSIIFGEVFGDTGRISPRVQAIADVLATADIQVTPVPDARVPIWDKFVYLVAFSGFTGAARAPIGPVWKNPLAQEMFYACSREVAAIAQAEGVTISAEPLRHAEGVHGQHPADDEVVAADRSRAGQAHRGRGAAGRGHPPRDQARPADADHLDALLGVETLGVRDRSQSRNRIHHTEAQKHGNTEHELSKLTRPLS